MSCLNPVPIYIVHSKEGIDTVSASTLNKNIGGADGYTISIQWTKAFIPTDGYLAGFNLAYNIYYSTNRDNVFSEYVKEVAIDPTSNAVDLLGFIPGQIYYFSVRAFLYSPNWYNLNLLPSGISPGLVVYPEGVLLSNITDTSNLIPISDISIWPAFGIIQIGVELIRYSSIDIPNNNLMVANINTDRGFLGTQARIHNVNGFDGYSVKDPIIKFYKGLEETNTVILNAVSGFHDPHFSFTFADGYRSVNADINNSDLSASDIAQTGFPAYDYSGYHRTSPVDLLTGKCIGSYIFGSRNCADGYGIGFEVRNLSLVQANDQRLETLLSIEGEPVVLVKRMTEGIICPCMESNAENPKLRCPICYGVGYVSGYSQYFDTRNSDSRIRVRFDPAQDLLNIMDEGFESGYKPTAWTLSLPEILQRDFLIRFDANNNESFRYKVKEVSRNVLLQSLAGAQKLILERVRKTDPIYMWSAIRDTSTMPRTITTSIGLLAGPNGTMIPHTHTLVVDENITNITQINETTSISAGHNHRIFNGIIKPNDGGLGHQHTILFP